MGDEWSETEVVTYLSHAKKTRRKEIRLLVLGNRHLQHGEGSKPVTSAPRGLPYDAQEAVPPSPVWQERSQAVQWTRMFLGFFYTWDNTSAQYLQLVHNFYSLLSCGIPSLLRGVQLCLSADIYMTGTHQVL